MKSKLTSLLLAFLLSVLSAAVMSAQAPLRLSGEVLDESGYPLVGVVVMADGSSTAVVTDADGKFTINAPAGTKSLTFTCLGMNDETLEIGNQKIFNVIMTTDKLSIQETVVIGYGTMSKHDLSTSVASVKSDALTERASSFNVLQGLAGKVAGVRSTSMSGRPGGSQFIRIRGNGSINASSDPIYVLDGAIGVDPKLINPSDIESLEILKDAAATSMYGAQGANGVVLITTKSGKQGKGSVSYDGYVGVSMMNRKLDLCNAEQFMQVQERAYAYSGKTMPHLTTPMEHMFYYKKDASGNYEYDDRGLLIASPKYDTDWQKELTQNALLNNHNLSFSQGNDKTSIYASMNYNDQQGLFKYTYSKRMTGTINLKSKITDWLDITAMATGGTYSNDSTDDENGFGQGALRNMIEMPPIVPVRYEDGTWGRKHDYPNGENGESPLKLMQEKRNVQKQTYFVMNAAANIHFTKDLTLTVKGDYQINNNKDVSYAKAGLFDYTENNGGYADISNSDSRRWSTEEYLSYNKSFFDEAWRASFVLGASWYYTHAESSSSGSEQFFDDSFDYYNLGAGSVTHNPSSGMSEQSMNSYYFRMNHNLFNKYMFGFTFRADGASNFGANNKFGYFPSGSFAWVMSEEPFFEPAKNVMNNFKIRLSYGQVGNAGIPSYRTISQYGTGQTIMSNTQEAYVTLTNLGNADLKWETSTQLNFGLDVAFFNNRLEFIADIYDKATTDLLFSKQVPTTTGYTSSWTNLGEIRNRGVELTLTSHNISNSNFSWDTDLIFSKNKILVVDINDELLSYGGGYLKEGEEWGAFYLLNRIGTWGLDEIEEAAKYNKKPGDLKYEDVNNDYVIDENDKKFYKGAQPKGEITMVNTFWYKGFSLMIDLNAQWGFYNLNKTRTMLENRQLYANSIVSVLDGWTPESQNTLVGAIRQPSDMNWGENNDDTRMWEKGDFLRIRNIMLSYDFKHSVFKNTKFVKGLMLGVSCENPYILTGYTGYDPEVGAWGNPGIDFYGYPRPTVITGNLKITF